MSLQFAEKLSRLEALFTAHPKADITAVPEGFDALVLGRILQLQVSSKFSDETKGNLICFVARDGARLNDVEAALSFFTPPELSKEAEILRFPAWDCLPYDRVSPSHGVTAERLATLAKLAARGANDAPAILLTTPSALLQRLPPKTLIAEQLLNLKAGQVNPMDDIIIWLNNNGFERVSTVREKGEYAVRGGILDLFVPAHKKPLRLDFFGDGLESIRQFDLETQRSEKSVKSLKLSPMSEVALNDKTTQGFRKNYRATFGAPKREDVLYQAISEGRRYAGLEHWLPMFYGQLDSLFDYIGMAPMIFDHHCRRAMNERFEQVEDHYQARVTALEDKMDSDGAAPYHPVAVNSLYLNLEEVEKGVENCIAAHLSPFEEAEVSDKWTLSMGAKQGKNFAAERAATGVNIFESLINHMADLREGGKQVLLASWSQGSLERFRQVLSEHGCDRTQKVSSLKELESLPKGVVGLGVLTIEQGFETDKLAVIGEQDVLGDRLVRKQAKRRKDKDVISEASSLSAGDIVVHVDHGIGRFIGLRTIEVSGAAHDCLELHYHGDDRLFLPVENIELLTRYGSDDANVVLDKLGGVAWQARKTKLKKQLLEMAGQLIDIAAARAMNTCQPLSPPDGVYGEFAAGFPYEETEDQQMAIDAVLSDMASGRPMDRLVCGDVGFGKTEVALRAAFVAAMAGKQVAVVVPTTLLARQHYKNFKERFQKFPIKVGHASRLVGTKAINQVKQGLNDGTLDIVVGTHALLAESVKYKRLGLLIIDEEQRFGVKHKERLKELRADIHVLTLSATPIPRTLQLALTGVRELSLITTAPVDRMAVRTFVSPFDKMMVREALLRERYRGGQSFYVCPRVSDIDRRLEFLQQEVPELKIAVAHGQMTSTALEDVMNAFYSGQYDVLLSTTIVESGLDIPTANTLIVHRADQFGLAQLYQLRGRVGRSKTRAYAIYTLPANRVLTETAERRLKVLQSLDTLGAGFQLASHDLDIRGAGNLLGDAQSGHIKEVGFELYQQMLEEAVAQMKAGGEMVEDEQWSPTINVGTTVMMPEHYVPDLTLRLQLYRRLADLEDAAAIDEFGAELIDRFGPLPSEVDHLLKLVYVKQLCLKANIERLDVGPKGVVIEFRNKEFKAPVALMEYMGKQGSTAKIRPDHSLFFARNWETAEKRLNGAAVLATQFVKMLD